MATTIDSSSNPLAAYGYDSATGQQLAQSLGLTPQQLAAAMATTPQTGGGPNMQGGSYGKSAGFSLPGADQSSTIQQLQMLKAAGALGGGNQGQGGPPTSQMGQVSNDPMNAATNLGAAALGMPAIYNPTPGQIPAGSKGGIAQVASPVSSGTVPNAPSGPWNTTAGVMANQQQAQGAQVYQGLGGSGNPGNTALQGFYNMGIQQGTIPGQGTPATGGTPVGVKPANAPGSAPATPWATAPAAPGLQISGAPATPDWGTMAVHHSALQDAGKALYAHFGGDPSTATHADINDFHNQLQSTIGAAGAIATPFGNAPAGAANYTVGAMPGVPAPAAPGGPPKMATGGFVPGRGNGDTVPALLTPGEYVIPKQQAAQIFGGTPPIRMAAGGVVPGDPNDPNEPPEVRRQRLAVAAQQAAQSAQGTQSDQSSSSSSSGPSLGGYSGPTATQIAAQNASANNRIGSGGAGSLDNLGTLGDEGLIGSMGVGVGSGAGSGMPTQQAAGVASGLASGLTSAAAAYAAAFKNYKIQEDATEKFRGNVAPAAPAANFTQEQA